MKKYLLPLSVILVVLLPALIISIIKKDTITQETQVETEAQAIEEPYMIHLKNGENISEMELDTYVLHVLLGEIPADFEPEALKAQAVATRTYTLRKVLRQNKHDDADVCTNISCCQAYVAPTDYLATKGDEEDLRKIETAVADTTGEVLTYQGNLIEATYFSCSGGMTEDAAAVWGTSVPYLVSVASPGEENAKYYEREFHYTCEEFLAKLGLDSAYLFSEDDLHITYTAGGGVEQMTILDVSISGTQLRTLLGLPSTAVTLSVRDNEILITTKGYGHRVGMSQYGADAMAVTGKRYDEILNHYYPGTNLTTFTSAQMQAVFDKEGNL